MLGYHCPPVLRESSPAVVYDIHVRVQGSTVPVFSFGCSGDDTSKDRMVADCLSMNTCMTDLGLHELVTVHCTTTNLHTRVPKNEPAYDIFFVPRELCSDSSATRTIHVSHVSKG